MRQVNCDIHQKLVRLKKLIQMNGLLAENKSPVKLCGLRLIRVAQFYISAVNYDGMFSIVFLLI